MLVTALLRSRRSAVLLTGSAIALGAVACGQSAQQASTQGAADAPPQRAAPGGTGGRSAPSTADLAVVARKLGVSAERLKAAMQSAMGASGPLGGPPSADTFASLAEELGVSQAKLRQALSSIVPRGPPGGAGPPPAA